MTTTKVYGGLFLENLLRQDAYYELQMRLFDKGLIRGIQLRIAHPSFTPDLTAKSFYNILSKLPDDIKLVIHCGAENSGVDFGESFDEWGIFAEQNITESWEDWNLQTFKWALLVSSLTSADVVVHPGYGKSIKDIAAREKMNAMFESVYSGNILLENVPAIVNKKLRGTFGKTDLWSNDEYRGFGGTPDDMSRIINDHGGKHKCLIDFTHLIVTVNQANANLPHLQSCKNLERVIDDYLKLPHSKICHFSGVPDLLVDNHDCIDIVSEPIRDALRKMEAVCLEIPFNAKNPDITIKTITRFYEQYLS